MAKRKKYNRLERLKANMKGSVIVYDGYDDNELKARTAQGVPFDYVMLDYLISFPWRWSIEVKFVFKHGELSKIVQVQVESGQQLMLNDLTDVILEQQELAALELGDYWEFDRKIWSAKVL